MKVRFIYSSFPHAFRRESGFVDPRLTPCGDDERARGLIFFFYFTALCSLLSALCLSGCGPNWEKTFIRKRVKPAKPAQFDVGNETQRPYGELYKEHYRYWQSWQDELIKGLGRNYKADLQNIREARRQLASLKKYLQPEKAKTVDKLLDGFDKATAPLLARQMQSYEYGVIERRLESVQSQISSRLHPKKTKDFLLPTPLPFDMKDYQGDEPVLTSKAAQIKPSPDLADTKKDAEDDLTYEKFRNLPGP